MCDGLQDLVTSLVEILVSPKYQLQDAPASCCSSEEASPEGLGDDRIHILQPRMLYLVQRCLHGQEASMYFSTHAAPLVPFWFESQVRLMTQAGGTMAVEHGKLEGELPNLKPYTDVLGMMRTMLYVCRMFCIILCVCRMLHAVRCLKWLHKQCILDFT